MKRTLVLVLFSALLFAETKPPEDRHAPTDQAALAVYWHMVAAHHAQTSVALQHEAQAKTARESVIEIDKQIDAQKKKLCGEKETLDESGTDPVCVAKRAE